MLLVSISFLVGALKSFIVSSVPAVFKVANVAFWRAHCKLASPRSAFLLKEWGDYQISGLMRVTAISRQFSGGSYFANRLKFLLVEPLAPMFIGQFGQLFVVRLPCLILIPEGGSQLL